MNLFKSVALAAIVAGSALAPAATARQDPIETYYAELGRWDHFNSNGQRLRSAAAIIRQDRANYHKFHRRDVGDQGDRFFDDAGNRARLEAMLNAGHMDRESRDRIINGTPTIRVDIYRNYIDVAVD